MIINFEYLNNLQFNPIIVKSKTFQLHSVSCLICIIYFFTLYKLKWVQTHTKYNEVQFFLINFYFSFVVPLNIYWKNPSLRNYLQNDLLGKWFMFMNFLTVFQHWNIKWCIYYISTIHYTLSFSSDFLTHFENSFITLSCAYSSKVSVFAKILMYNQHM